MERSSRGWEDNQGSSKEKTTIGKGREQGVEGKTQGSDGEWELPQELLDGGQGKRDSPTLWDHVATKEDRGGDNDTSHGNEVGGGQGGNEGTMKWVAPAGVPPRPHIWGGLAPPILQTTGQLVTGTTKGALRRQSAWERRAVLAAQAHSTQWTTHLGTFVPTISEGITTRGNNRGGMCPQGLALQHPAAALLKEWSKFGCPAQTGQPWTRMEMAAAIERGPHESALMPEVIAHFGTEVAEKLAKGQAIVVDWNDI